MSERHLVVIEPGLLTTVQDLGRTGLLRFGVTTGGALDQAALILGNRLVGNEPNAAGLEITLIGPRLRVTADVVMAVTGADLGAVLNGSPVPGWQPIRARAGDELAFTPRVAMSGARAYLCFAGGIALPEVMGGAAPICLATSAASTAVPCVRPTGCRSARRATGSICCCAAAWRHPRR